MALRKCLGNFQSFYLKNNTSARVNVYLKRPISLSAAMRYSEKEEFLKVFPEIVSSIVQRIDKFHNVPGISSFIQDLLEYNSVGGNKTRGLMTVQAYRKIENADNITEQSLKKIRMLGWYVEMLQTSMILLDDIIDNSSTRRGYVCWYRLPGVGVRAMNDCVVFLGIVYDSIRANFGNEPWYPRLLDYLNEGMLLLLLGQHMDIASLRNFDHFTMDHYRAIASTKMTTYTFKIPIYYALILANKPHEGVFGHIEDLLKDMGMLIMMQNDYMDCFGDDTVSGKEGTDIQEGKCTWFSVTALQRCSAAQRAELEACYGSADAASVQRVKRLYEDLQLPAVYRDSEKIVYDNIITRINALPSDNVVTPAVLLKLLDMIYYMRSKPEKNLVS